ncbi:FO synthase [Mycobacteroides abscessus]|nr:FO synthase [Mycobacteroides abscessus]
MNPRVVGFSVRADDLRVTDGCTNVPDDVTPLPNPAFPSRKAASSTALRRVLRRARDGVTLNVDEAALALTARGDDLADLMASAARAVMPVWSPAAAWVPRGVCRSRIRARCSFR